MNAAAAQPPTEDSPVAEAVNNVANAAVGAVNTVANAVNNAATGAANAVTNAVNSATNMVSNVVNGGTNNKNAGSFNSLIPLGNGSPPANNRPANNIPANNKPANNKPANNKPANNMFANNPPANNKPANNKPANVGVNNAPPTFSNATLNNMASSPWAIPLGIFVGLIVAFLIAFTFFEKQIRVGYEYALSSLQSALGRNTQPPVMADTIPIQGNVTNLTVPPSPPQDMTPAQHTAINQTITEKILPSGTSNEVFNVSDNKFTYYDAEPLCKALGAELATYEQLKNAWSKGADWCNYGWVKGQMAIYPTQQGTYDKLQAGPEDERMACGTTGINGGFFDNPDMLYGVNCYGKKPSQSSHDEEKLMEQGKIPKSPSTLKVDNLVNKFKTEADSLFVKPFNDDKWSTK